MTIIYILFTTLVIYFILCILSPKKQRYIFTTSIYTFVTEVFQNLAQLSLQRQWNALFSNKNDNQITEGGETKKPGAFIAWEANHSHQKGRLTNIKIEPTHLQQRLELVNHKISVAKIDHILEYDEKSKITHWTLAYEESIPFFQSPIYLFRSIFSNSIKTELVESMQVLKEQLEHKN